MNDQWDGLSQWWLAEVRSDPAYQTDVLPLLEGLLGDVAGDRILDLGCGEGRVMATLQNLGARPVGCDLNEELANRAGRHGPAFVGRLPSLGFIKSEAFDGIVVVLVIEHLAALAKLFEEAVRVTKPGGYMVAVLNHPVYTAPGSAPIIDPDDGELLWRWGAYLTAGSSVEQVRGASITFHHRPFSVLLSDAARSGWMLRSLEERSISGSPPALAGQEEFPRLLGACWRRVR